MSVVLLSEQILMSVVLLSGRNKITAPSLHPIDACSALFVVAYKIFHAKLALPFPLRKKITMRSCAKRRQNQNILIDLINQQPIRLDMTFSEPGIISDQLMVSVLWRQSFSTQQLVDDLFQPGEIIATLFHSLIILAKF